MSAFLLGALLMGLIGLVGLFIFPWVGAPLLLAAILLVVVGIVWEGAVAASDKSTDPKTRDVDTPRMPGPD